MGQIKELCKEVHQNAIEHGWWEKEQDFGTLIALCHSELSEALEEHRKAYAPDVIYYSGYNIDKTVNITQNVSSNNCTKPEGIPMELADVIIRIMDMCEHYGVDLEAAILEKHEYNKTRQYKHGGKAF